eukprot:749938-Hanusia_phi.AAC.2
MTMNSILCCPFDSREKVFPALSGSAGLKMVSFSVQKDDDENLCSDELLKHMQSCQLEVIQLWSGNIDSSPSQTTLTKDQNVREGPKRQNKIMFDWMHIISPSSQVEEPLGNCDDVIGESGNSQVFLYAKGSNKTHTNTTRGVIRIEAKRFAPHFGRRMFIRVSIESVTGDKVPHRIKLDCSKHAATVDVPVHCWNHALIASNPIIEVLVQGMEFSFVSEQSIFLKVEPQQKTNVLWKTAIPLNVSFACDSQQLVFLDFCLKKKGSISHPSDHSKAGYLNWNLLAKKYAEPCIDVTNDSERGDDISVRTDDLGFLYISWLSLFPSQNHSNLIFQKPRADIMEDGWTICINCRAWNNLKSFLPLSRTVNEDVMKRTTQRNQCVCAIHLSLPECKEWEIDVTAHASSELEILPTSLFDSIKLFKSLFDPIDAYVLSLKCVNVLNASLCSFELSRERTSSFDEDDDHLTYGEVEFLPFLALMSSVRDLFPPDPVFCDLGCGKPRAAKSVVGVDKLKVPEELRHIGIELLPSLCRAARAIHEQMIVSCKDGACGKKASIEYHQSDFLDDDHWTVANVVYIASLCFDASMMFKLHQKAIGLQSGWIPS